MDRARAPGSSPTTSTWCCTSSRPRPGTTTGSRICGATCRRSRSPRQPASVVLADNYDGRMLSTDHKGTIAETAIVARAVRLGIDVYLPVNDGLRWDLLFGA